MTELVISSPHHTEGDSPFRGGEVISAALPLISMSPKKEEATCNATAIAIMANLHPLPQLCQSITSLECHSVAERIEPFLSLLDSLSFLSFRSVAVTQEFAGALFADVPFGAAGRGRSRSPNWWRWGQPGRDRMMTEEGLYEATTRPTREPFTDSPFRS